MNIELTENQVKNLEEFLSRVGLKGNEAMAFADIILALRKPAQIEQNVIKEGSE